MSEAVSGFPFPLPRTWFGKEITLGYVRQAFGAGTRTIRIACGFFTLRGWGLIRTSTVGKQVFILVGIDEPGEERARTALVRDIMRDLVSFCSLPCPVFGSIICTVVAAHMRATSPFVKWKSGDNRLPRSMFAAYWSRFTTRKGCSVQ